MKHRAGAGGQRAEIDARISALAGRYGIPSAGAGQLMALLGLLTGDPLAPTAVREPRRVLDDHLADSLVALELAEVRAASRLADLGAGPGLPGLPLAVALPGAEVVLVESNGRKCSFLERAVQACGLTNAMVVHARAEAWPEGLAGFDVVLARALAPLSVVAEYGAPLLRIGGALVAWRGRRDADEEAAAAIAAAELGLELRPPQRVVPYRGSLNRHLQLMLKVSETPGRFPRRPGMARKRPLGVAPSDRTRR